jgi:murein DD-endopeptidase MepM/ murein hydrolase activator NlpD
VGLLASAAFYATNLPERSSTLSNSLVNSGDGFSSSSVASRSLASDIPVTPPAAFARNGPSSVGSTRSQGLASPAEPIVPSAAGPAAPLPDCDPFQSALYCVYEIKEGDTLFKIADKFGFKDSNGVKNYEYLIQSNQPAIVSEKDVLQPGQKVRIPRGTNRILHTVLTSDTLAQLADQYGSNPDEIAAITENNITDRNSLAIGKEILIPNPTRLSVASPSATAPRATATTTTPRPTATGPTPAPTNTAPPPVAKGFIWPVTGRISSYFGPSHPLGIDIDLINTPTASIGAAKSGVVTFAGGNACCSYGYYVVVDHGDGDQTLYAHFSSISVSVGQSVAQGQRLGIAGRTGYATGIHLHFEVTRSGVRINPLSVLP